MRSTLVPILLWLFMAGCTTVKKEPLVIGHRGASGHVAENTVESVEKALELGVDMVEIDVFRCKSREIVVIHDETVGRTTNGSGHVEALNRFQLLQLRIEGKYKIPVLQDILKKVDKKAKINIELKGVNTADGVAHILKYYIEKRGWQPTDFVISSFDWQELRALREKSADIPIGILVEGDLLEALAIAKELNAVSVHPDHKTLTQENVEAIQDAGFLVYTWTVNDPSDIKKMKGWGVDGIISDYPERVKR